MAGILQENELIIGHAIRIFHRDQYNRYENFARWGVQDFQQTDFTDPFTNFQYFYFPFKVSNYSDSSELDGLFAEISVSNTTWARNKLYLDSDIKGAKVELKIYFLMEDGGADRGEDPVTNYLTTMQPITKIGVVDSVSYIATTITFKIQSRLSAIDAVVPAETFTGEKFRNLPYDNSSNNAGLGI